MNTINDPTLRRALHSLYVELFKAVKREEVHFNANHVTRLLTSIMGSRPWSWRVVGITPEALKVFAQHDFRSHDKLVQRGHLIDRNTTARALCITPSEPLSEEQFFKKFLAADRTVLMLRKENPSRRNKPSPAYIPIDKRQNLFPCGSLVGWCHGADEIQFLSELHERWKAGETKLVKPIM